MFVMRNGSKELTVYYQNDVDLLEKHGFKLVSETPKEKPVETTTEPKKRGRPAKEK